MRIKRSNGPIGDITGSIAGVLSVFEQLKADRGLIARSVLPLLLSSAAFALGTYLCVRFVFPGASKWLPAGTALSGRFVRWMLSPLVFFATLLVFYSFYSFLSFIIGLFLPPLIKHTEIKHDIETHTGLLAFLGSPFALLRSSLLVLLLIVIFLPLNLIPFAGGAVFFLFFIIFTLVFCGIPFYELVFSRYGFSFKTRVYLFWKYKWAIAGTGAGFIILSSIPFAGLLAHVGAILQVSTLYCEKARHEIASLDE